MLCWSCRAMKAPDDFYKNNRTTCKACVAKRKTEQRHAKRENRPPRRFTCAECGKEVEAPVRSGPTPKYCSRACKDAPKLRREKALRDQEQANRAPASRIFTGYCADCGAAFVSRGPTTYRCDACQSDHRRRETNAIWHRRRAVKQGADAETFTAAEILDRDGWVCQLCGEPIVLPDGKEPGSPSIDHIVPLAMGGTHTRDNVQAAHFGCNSAKGTRQVA